MGTCVSEMRSHISERITTYHNISQRGRYHWNMEHISDSYRHLSHVSRQLCVSRRIAVGGCASGVSGAQRSRTLRLKAHRSLNWQPVFICEAFSHFAGDRFETRSRQPRINTVSTTYQHRINTVSTLYEHYTNYTDRAPRASESRLSAPGVP